MKNNNAHGPHKTNQNKDNANNKFNRGLREAKEVDLSAEYGFEGKVKTEPCTPTKRGY